MVADGVHIMLSLALVFLFFRSNRAEPYLVAALAAAFPDIDTFVFHPLIEYGYVGGILWSHRGLTHSLLAGALVVVLLSHFGPWRAAALGIGSHIVFDLLTGGVRAFAPLTGTLYGVSLGWVLLNLLTSVFAVSVILGGLLTLKYDLRLQLSPPTPETAFEWLR